MTRGSLNCLLEMRCVPWQKLTEKGFSAIFVQIRVERNGQVTWAKKTRPKFTGYKRFYKKQVESRWIKGLLLKC